MRWLVLFAGCLGISSAATCKDKPLAAMALAVLGGVCIAIWHLMDLDHDRKRRTK